MIHSDWHLHTDASYDAKLPLETMIAAAKEMGFRGFGVTDHLNYNDASFWENIRQSAENFKRLKSNFPNMRLGVELTPIPKPQYEHIARTGNRDSWIPPIQDKPYDIELAGTQEELMALGVQYAVGATHWHVDVADHHPDVSVDAQIREWHRQQMWLACDPRVTILGHPWSCNRSWYEDFSVVPASMHEELASALLENGKYAECNAGLFVAKATCEKFRHQYAEFLRYLFERGVPITFGSDCHGKPDPIYQDRREETAVYLKAAGFREGDITDLPDAALWQ